MTQQQGRRGPRGKGRRVAATAAAGAGMLLLLGVGVAAPRAAAAAAYPQQQPGQQQPGQMEGKYARSPKGHYVAFLRLPDDGQPQLWMRRVRDGKSMPLRLRYLGVDVSDIRALSLSWSGSLIRLTDGRTVVYFDTRGRLVDAPPPARTETTGGSTPAGKRP